MTPDKLKLFERYGKTRVFCALVVRRDGQLFRTHFMLHDGTDPLRWYKPAARERGYEIVAVIWSDRYHVPDDDRVGLTEIK